MNGDTINWDRRQRKKTGLRNDALGTAMFEIYAWLFKYS